MDLIINSFGTSLSRDNNCFVILHKDGKQRVPVQGIASIQIGKGAQITSDAVLLAIENEIEILFLNNAGEPVGRIWSPKYGSVSTIRKGQVNFSLSKDAVDWIKETILQKIENQQALILAMQIKDDLTQRLVDKTINKLDDYKSKIRLLMGETVSDIAPALRGWEGLASKVYFDTLNLFIPEQYRFENRSQHPAMDIVNAFLNYGYGILYGKIEGSLIKAGIDPYIGIFHRDNYNRPILVYDVIELYRIWVDYVVYTLMAQNAVTDEFYSVKEDGSYWLENLGRRIIIQSLNDYLDENIFMNGLNRSRETHIFLFAQNLAQLFKKYS
ncbi:MAG: CRISPR-associated endonuclease Cas1 [Paludibacteraceae bacterium]|nr:CRISPR-associated endonuclease Cas1 [Paludibacteraceae bacterium]